VAVVHPTALIAEPRGDRVARGSMLRELARRIDAFQERFGHGVSWFMLAMVAVVFGDVIFRYLFNRSWVFMQELEWHFFGLVFLLGAGYTMLYDEHVRVDIVYARLAPRQKAWVDLILLFIFFFPTSLLIVYTAWPFVRNSFAVLEGSPDPGGLPARWALKSVIIIGYLFLILQGISQAIKNLYWAMGWEEREERVHEVH
jgi:TRAP-type mannitol/chloroaromatic compound transport system permease small subunit